MTSECDNKMMRNSCTRGWVGFAALLLAAAIIYGLASPATAQVTESDTRDESWLDALLGPAEPVTNDVGEAVEPGTNGLVAVAGTNVVAEVVATNDIMEIVEEGPKRRPLVVLKQSTIKGRIFLLVSDEEDFYGADIKLAIYVKGQESREEDRIFKTKTDKDGNFELPDLEVGTYSLYAGRLVLELQVEDQETGPTYSRRIPKTVLIFMPASMQR